MPQIGWFELLVIIIVAILVIGPKDFPIVLKKVGSWIGSIKRYFSDVQKNVSEITNLEENNNKKDNKISKSEALNKLNKLIQQGANLKIATEDFDVTPTKYDNGERRKYR